MGMAAATPDRVARLLFGSVRRDVLALLLGRSGDRFYLREIMRAVGGGSGAVQRELRELVEAGLVTREEGGNQVYFSANTHAPIFAELKAIVEKTAGVADVLRSLLAPLAQEGGIAVALVYGSVAGGKQAAQSDVDLLIVGDLPLPKVVPVLRKAESRLGREVNPSVYPPKEFREKMRRGAPFLKRVLAGPKIFVIGSDRELRRLGQKPADVSSRPVVGSGRGGRFLVA